MKDEKVTEKESSSNNFEKLLLELRAQLSKCKYRKVLEEIMAKGSLYYNTENGWKLTELKVKSMFKIIYKKIKNHSESTNSVTYNKSLEGWFDKIDTELDYWVYDLTKKEDRANLDNEEMDTIIQFFLEEIYLMCLHMKNEKRFADAVGMLATGERIVKSYKDYTRYPKTLNIMSKILLFLSSLLIGDNDFESAKNYQAESLKLSFREIFLKCDVMDGLNYSELSPINQHNFNKIFINIILAFYQRGVCEENLGQITKAIDAYKQSKWFALKYIKSNLPELAQFVNDVENRALNYHQLLDNMKEKSDDKIHKNHIGNILLSKESQIQLDNDNLNIENRFDKTEKIIQNINFRELEYESKQNDIKSTKGIVLSTVHLVNNLMSKEFKDIVKNMNSLDVNVMNKETQEKLQKRINELRAEKNFQKKLNPYIKKKTRSPILSKFSKYGNKVRRSQSTIFDFNPIPIKTNLLDRDNSLKKTKTMINFHTINNMKNNDLIVSKNSSTTGLFSSAKQSAIINNNINSLQSGSKLKSTRPQSCYQYDKIQKIQHDEFVFDISYRNKMEYLNRLNQKEMKFQKQLLGLKKFEKVIVDDTDQLKTKDEAEIFFKKNLGQAMSKLTFSETQGKKMDLMKNQYSKNERLKENIENIVIKSLDPKQLERLKLLWKSEEKPNLEIREEFLVKMNTNQNNNFGNMNMINRKNQELEDIIDNKLDQLDKQDNFYKKLLSPRGNDNQRRLKSSNRSSMKKRSMFVKDMDYFLKEPVKKNSVYARIISKYSKLK